MTDQGRKFLSDILRAIEVIDSFTSDIKAYDNYVSDLKTQSAVERQLGIIVRQSASLKNYSLNHLCRMPVR